VTVLHVGSGGAQLRVEASAPGGYRATGSAKLAPLGDGAERTDVALAPPPAAVSGTVCATVDGAEPITLAGTGDPRALVHTHGMLDGAPQQAAFSLTLLEARERSPLARTGQLADRAAALSPFGPWWFWLLAALLVLALPALVVAALSRALRDEV
jgi:hypothetical protein